MKYVSICLLIVAFVVVSVNSFTVPKTADYTKQSSVFLAKAISEVFIERLKQDLRRKSSSPGVQVPVIPTPSDPAFLDPIAIPLEFAFGGFFNVTGNLNLTEAAEVTGLSKLVDDFNFILLTQTITYNVDIPSVNIAGKYDMNLKLDLGSVHDVNGKGDLSGGVNNVFLKINAKLKIPVGNQPIGLNNLTVDLGFKDLTLDGGEAMVDGTYIIDWASVGSNLQTYFDTIWGTEEPRLIIVEMVRCVVDDFINECTVAQLAAGELNCLKDAINLECLGIEPEPETSPTSESTTPSVSTTPSGALSTSSSSLFALLSVLIAKYVF